MQVVVKNTIEMKEIYIRFFENKESQNSPKSIGLLDWLTTDEYKNQIEAIRQCESKEESDRLKSKLPCSMPSMRIDGSHSGFIAIDVDGVNHGDNLEYTPAELKAKISQIVNVAYCGYSCSGKGVWALIPIFDTTKHLEHFKALEVVFQRIGLTIDSSCKNVNRLRFASYDPEPYLNEQAEKFSLILADKPKSKISLSSPNFVRSANIFEEFNQKADVVGLLQNHGWKVQKTKGDKIYLTRPDKTDGISGEFDNTRRLFYCYTNSAQFDGSRAYNASQLLAVLECDNDMKRTAKEIRKLIN